MCGSNFQGTEKAGVPAPGLLGRTAEPQTDTCSQAENILINYSAGDGSSEDAQQSYGLATPKL